jgi:hypothetical protein
MFVTTTQAEQLERSTRECSAANSTPMWLWWNILCLDAPAIALGWHLLAMRALKAGDGSVAVVSGVILFAAVWSIYVFDHWLDSRRGMRAHARHAFMQRGGKFMLAIATVAIAACATLVFMLPGAVVKSGSVLVLVTLAYLAAAHRRGSLWARELAVGVIFASGALLTAFSTSALHWQALEAAILLVGVCVLNCALSEVREGKGLVDVHWSTRWIGTRACIIGSGLFAAAALSCMMMRGSIVLIFAALALSALLLTVLSGLRARISADAFRVLADAALLMPFAILAVR